MCASDNIRQKSPISFGIIILQTGTTLEKIQKVTGFFVFLANINQVRGLLKLNIELPFRFTRNTMYNFLGRVISDGQPVEQEITLDFTNLDYIEPVAITILSNTLQWLDKNDIVTRFRLPNQSQIGSHRNCPIKYLDDSMFFKEYLGTPLTPAAKIRPTTRPLELINYSKSHFWIEQNKSIQLLNIVFNSKHLKKKR